MWLKTIETENIIFSYFYKNEDKKEVELSTLMNYVSALQEKFCEQNELVYINYTRTSLINAIMLHLDLFDLDNNTIRIISDIKKISCRIEFYNSKLPYEIRKDYMKFFEDVDREIKSSTLVCA